MADQLAAKWVFTIARNTHVTEEASGDGVKQVYASEFPSLNKLRRVHS
jgi:hypothetical protein